MPLSQNARIGLIVGGAAALLFIVCAAGVVALVVVNRDRGTGGTGRAEGKGSAERPVSEGNEKDDESYILGHRWWKKKPSKADLDRLVGSVTEGKSGQILRVNSDTSFDVLSVYQVDEKVTEKNAFWFRVAAAKRPTRTEVLVALRRELDRVEFRDGPGR